MGLSLGSVGTHFADSKPHQHVSVGTCKCFSPCFFWMIRICSLQHLCIWEDCILPCRRDLLQGDRRKSLTEAHRPASLGQLLLKARPADGRYAFAHRKDPGRLLQDDEILRGARHRFPRADPAHFDHPLRSSGIFFISAFNDGSINILLKTASCLLIFQ